MSKHGLSYFQKQGLWLVGLNLLVLLLIASNLYLLFEDWLVVMTATIVVAYVCCYISVQLYSNNKASFEQIESFIRMKNQGVNNTQLVFGKSGSPFKTIAQLLDDKQIKTGLETSTVLESLFSRWPMPVVILNKADQLSYFNQAFYQKLNKPLINGMSFEELEFEWQDSRLTHPQFDTNWQLKVFAFENSKIIMGHNIANELQDNRYQVQQQMMRVLSHELNNSLTPMASMSDTLLDLPELPEDTTRNALTRIRNRSEALLTFITRFKQANHIPAAKIERFDLSKLVESTADDYQLEVKYSGDSNLIADPILLEQLMINLLKNAKEAKATKVELLNEVISGYQRLTLIDNGHGFQNLENVFTPLYTTKSEGEGLGMYLCQELVAKHGGEIAATNTSQGAKLTVMLPPSVSPI